MSATYNIKNIQAYIFGILIAIVLAVFSNVMYFDHHNNEIEYLKKELNGIHQPSTRSLSFILVHLANIRLDLHFFTSHKYDSTSKKGPHVNFDNIEIEAYLISDQINTLLNKNTQATTDDLFKNAYQSLVNVTPAFIQKHAPLNINNIDKNLTELIHFQRKVEQIRALHERRETELTLALFDSDQKYNETNLYIIVFSLLISILIIALLLFKIKKTLSQQFIIQQQHRALVESTSDWIWQIDEQDRFTYVSSKIKDLLGYEPNEVLGRSAFDLMSEEEAANVDEVYRKLIEKHQPFNNMINVNQHKDGHEVILESSGVPLFDEEGNWRGYRGIDRDITERKKAEDELRTTKRRLDEAQTMAKIGSWELDLVKSHLWWSDETFRIFDIDTNQFDASYDAFLNAIHPEDRDRVNEAYTSSLETKEPYSITHRLLMKDGSIKYVYERCETLYNEADEAYLSKGTIQDITEQVTAEKIIQESENRFHTLARLAPVGIFQGDTTGQCLYVNETWLNFTGMEYEKAMGYGWSEALHPEDKDIVFNAWNTAAQENKSFKHEYRFLRPDGKSTWVYGQAEANRDEAGNVTGYVGTITNINERKQAELKHFEAQRRLRKQQRATLLFAQKQKNVIKDLNIVYRQMCESVANNLDVDRVSVWLLDKSGDTLQCKNLYRASTNQHETGISLNVNNYPAYFKALKSNRIISADDACSNPDTMEFCKDYFKPNQISSMIDAPLRDGSGHVIGVLCFEHVGEQRQWHSDEKNFASAFADMLSLSIELYARNKAETELKAYRDQLEDIVKTRTRELEDSNNELESFTYSVSHDLRTPLRGIDGFSRILLEKYADEFDEQGQDYLQRVRAGAQRMGHLINDMLQLSRASREEIKFQNINSSIIAEQSIKEIKQAEPDRCVEITIEPDLQTTSDPKQLRIILDNLIGNAWKFTSKRDGAKIEFGHVIDSDETIYYVRDNGAGFDMRYVDKLFKVFQRLHHTNEFPGTGVGLSTVSRLIKRLGGRIWAESNIDKGTTFYFTLDNSKQG